MKKTTNKEAICLIITLILNNIVLVSSQTVVESCSSGSLINAIYVSIIALLVTGLICILYRKFSGCDILDISHFVGGNWLKFIVGLIFVAYFVFTISVLLRRISDCLQIAYYPMTNIIYILLLFIIAAGIICLFRNNCISKANAIILPIVLASIILAFIGNFKNFDYYSIYPLLGNNIDSTFFSGLSNMFAFNGIAYLYFLPSNLNKPKDFHKIALISVFLSAIFFILSIASILFMFDNTLSSSELFPLYILIRYIEFGYFLQRLDSAFLLIWLISFISFFGILLDLCINIFKKITRVSDEKPIIYPLLLCIFAISLIIKNNYFLEVAENTISKILFFTIVIGLGLIILLIANFKKGDKTIKNE